MNMKSVLSSVQQLNVPEKTGQQTGSRFPEAKAGRDGHGFARGLLFLLIVIQFFPLPRLPVIKIAPENFLFIVALFLLSMRYLGVIASSASLMILLGLILTYAGLDQLHNFAMSTEVYFPAEHFRTVVYLALFYVACRDARHVRFFVKCLATIGAIQVIGGALVYFFGEPFTGIRAWMNMSSMSTVDIYISKGSQLAGLYGLPHIFSYLLASFPVLAIMLFHTEKRLIWITFALIMVAGLYLNAERAALGAVLLMYLIWMIRTHQRARNFAVFGLISVTSLAIIVAVEQFAPHPTDVEESASYVHGSLLDRFGKSTVGEIGGRLMWQVNGAVSVIKNPLLGPSNEDYVRAVLGIRSGHISEWQVARAPPPHNHYVNVGLHAGVMGWLILLVWLRVLWRMHVNARRTLARDKDLYLLHLGVSLALLGAMINAMFHNAGIFTPELATTSILGIYLAHTRLASTKFATPPARA
jgi:hypothetical protein